MNYRVLGRTGLKVGEIGMGCEGFVEQPYETVKAYIDRMEEAGMNCIDLYAPNPEFRSNLGKALRGRREKFILQAHLCSVWKDGQYKRTRKLSEVKEGFEDQLRRLETDHVEIGMIHYVDSLEDWHTVEAGEVMGYALALKEQGTIGCIGMSSHNPEAALAAVQSGLIDVLMFSVNPCYDLLPASEDVESRSSKCRAFPCRKGIDSFSVHPLCPHPSGCGLCHVRRPFHGGFDGKHFL